MANEVMGSISQLKIGNYYYNIRDAKVRETLSNMSDNTVSLQSLAFSNWELSKNLKTNDQMKTANSKVNTWFNDQWVLPVHINGIKFWIAKQTNGNYKLNFVHSIYEDTTDYKGYKWTDNEVKGTPTTVNQCIIIAHYRVRIYFTKQAAAAPQILKRELKGTDAGMTAASLNQTGWTRPFKIVGSTKVTAPHIFSGTHAVQTSIHLFDRIVRDSAQGNSGAAYKIGINDLTLSSGASAKYHGSTVRVLLIAQGYAQENLAPEEEDTTLISDVEAQYVTPEGGTGEGSETVPDSTPEPDGN